jgi:hypothetical protein
MDVLDTNISRYLAGEIPTAKEALDEASSEWEKLTKKFGIESQKAFYGKMW